VKSNQASAQRCALAIHPGLVKNIERVSMKKINKDLIMKITKITGNVFFYLIIVILILFSIANMQMKKENDIANIFGRGFMSVLTASMDGDQRDSFTTDDLIFVDVLDQPSADDINIDDIVVFFKLDLDDNPVNGSQPGFVTHRVVDSFDLNGQTYLITKGDANALADDKAIDVRDVLAVYQSKWVGAGRALKYLQTPTGFALTVIVPVAFLFIFQGIILTKNIIALNKEKLEDRIQVEKEIALQTLESEKDKIRQQILEELKKQQETKQ
jgi:signal peptidase I